MRERNLRLLGWLVFALAVLVVASFLAILRFDSPWDKVARVGDGLAAAALVLGISAWRAGRATLGALSIVASASLAVGLVIMWILTTEWQ